MESTSPLSDMVSPESTVTTLLSSSGHFRSSLFSSEFNTTFRYRDKEYDSASAALEAYIADFDRSQNIESSERLILPQSPLSTPRRPRMSTHRNKSVLRERLTDREVAYLTLPVSSLRHRDNRDRLSMTTDELLSIPRDGSMPVTHTTAFIQGRLSQSVASQARVSSNAGHRTGEHTEQNISHPHLSRNCSSCRCKGEPKVSTLKPDVPFVRCLTCAHRGTRAEQLLLSSPSRLQCRYSGNKADLGHTGISSVSDWIQDCDLTEPRLPSDVDLCDTLASITRASSWLADTEDNPGKTANQLSLKDLRLQFAEQISWIASERKSSDITESLVRDNRLESLIQKADEVLNSLSQRFGGAESLADSELNREEMKRCSTPPPLPIHSKGTADVKTRTLSVETKKDCSRDSTISQQPGPLEALKQMMFRLQAVEVELHRQQHPPVARTCSKGSQSRPESEAEQALSGATSLQRALHHLSRLKLLLEAPRGKHEEEKDIDEGRYSSSSADVPSAGFQLNMETMSDGDSSPCRHS
ncbi:lung adenoma susceptibility protein 2 isoform X1 [Syngnathus acus]|uniref:lung adenoma susceptibility protein 2 isoform X1 n=1 Tax=Syngnathus acus TaxID=161584 RepID=UPI001885E795|nr:lung adenoma susceptibility protein 2 isoform X1 [Syngnathus acus]XP_037121389.1 lung adenoma susceptibility protein 2 isoform X1 [Syngnathus acus]